MRRINIACISLTIFAAFAVSAQFVPSPTPPRYAEPQPITLGTGDLLQKIADAARVARTESNAGVNVARESGDWVFVFPLLGSTPGGGGTYFKSDTMLINNTGHTQNVGVVYFPVGNAGCAARTEKTYKLDANSWAAWSDFVQQFLQKSGLGSVIVVALDAYGNPDVTAKIDGSARIWTPIPGSSGTAAQGFAPVNLDLSANWQLSYGLRQDAGFRTNVGILNYSSTNTTATESRVFDVVVAGASGQTSFTITVPPCSLVMAPVPTGNYGPMVIGAQPRDAQRGWYGFASSVDNVSGDNWSSTFRPIQ